MSEFWQGFLTGIAATVGSVVAVSLIIAVGIVIYWIYLFKHG
jgi:hypothetical protein